ncbi:MAG: HAD-IIB family hydrolase [Piscinibacter sp.]|nr:HAD-IIB family hydrolase [Piscinibacter sp.]
MPPRPLAECPPAQLGRIDGVLTDIDDTLTRDGAAEPAALDALARLAAAGLPVIAVTGRPMGWSVPFAQAWPVRAIVAENGAVALFRDAAGTLRTEYLQDEPTRTHNTRRLAVAAQRVLREVPGATLARDSAGRVTDIAIDHAEFARLDAARIARVVDVMRAEGMHATVSSIHVNGWFGTHDKLAGARWIVRRLLGRDVDAERARWAYVGDSTNDQVMFGHFPLAVGVANLRDFAAQLRVWPAWITAGERGAGFAEFAAALLEARLSAAGRS